MKGIFENRKEFDMKLVKVNRNEVLKERSLYKKSNNLLLLEQFIESGMG